MAYGGVPVQVTATAVQMGTDGMVGAILFNVKAASSKAITFGTGNCYLQLNFSIQEGSGEAATKFLTVSQTASSSIDATTGINVSYDLGTLKDASTLTIATPTAFAINATEASA
ncbi:hypothetical protein [Cellulosilyticum ruminicola]|uniref:hypothetical protein n=1 Tax=Cellulosilyticum ruminicola TaxID=425254 RepID=UPI0006D1FDFE|nr:hypothetical protein [Cellulosilyticum ruminicola]